MNNEFEKEVFEYVLKIFSYYQPIVDSWGFDNPVVIENGIRFEVSGFIHTGYVDVILAGNDTFTVTLWNKDNLRKYKSKQTNIYLDHLVDYIDSQVEKSGTDEEYDQKIEESFKGQVHIIKLKGD